MFAEIKTGTPLPTIIREVTNSVDGFCAESKTQFFDIIAKVPMAYQKVNAIFSSPERKTPGSGGIFSIFVTDLCKGCAACVTACGDHQALRMVAETEEVNAEHETGTAFLDLLPDTSQKYLGLFNAANPADSKTATLRNMLMVRTNYDALVSGDGACAGCGEKSVLRSIAAVTEAYMRPVYHAKSDRFVAKAGELEKTGAAKLAALKDRIPRTTPASANPSRTSIMGLGGEDDKDTRARIDAYEAAARPRHRCADDRGHRRRPAHRGLQPQIAAADRRPPRQRHVRDGHGRAHRLQHRLRLHLAQQPASVSVDEFALPGRHHRGLAHGRKLHRRPRPPLRHSRAPHRHRPRRTSGVSEREYYDFTHFTDALMTDQEIVELPKVWVVGGDGGMGDIGYQNMSKVILQNRPNVKALMLDTQVYSNTGGQNSDSTPMLGGGDMNTYGPASQGKNTEKKTVAETFLAGHGSPFVAQVSMANAPKLYRAILDGLEYRGTMFLQAFTTCQPEHGVADDMALFQAQRVRDSRGVPEFVFDPRKGETYMEALDINGNPSKDLDWYETKDKLTGATKRYTVAHWCTTEARFRNHLRKVKAEQAETMIPLDNMLVRITQQDVVYRRYLDPKHRAFIPDFGVYITLEENGKTEHRALSRQLVMFCVERRKSWRMLQSKAGIKNREYEAQKALLAEVDAGKINKDEFLAHAQEMLAEKLGALVPAKA